MPKGGAALDRSAFLEHLGFHPGLPTSAMHAGADGAVTSPHKLLTVVDALWRAWDAVSTGAGRAGDVLDRAAAGEACE